MRKYERLCLAAITLPPLAEKIPLVPPCTPKTTEAWDRIGGKLELHLVTIYALSMAAAAFEAACIEWHQGGHPARSGPNRPDARAAAAERHRVTAITSRDASPSLLVGLQWVDFRRSAQGRECVEADIGVPLARKPSQPFTSKFSCFLTVLNEVRPPRDERQMEGTAKT